MILQYFAVQPSLRIFEQLEQQKDLDRLVMVTNFSPFTLDFSWSFYKKRFRDNYKSQLRRILSQNFHSLLKLFVYIAESCCNILIATSFL